MRSPQILQWEQKLKQVFDQIDRDLEAQYGSDWPLHPARPRHGSTSNPEQDGLFNIGAAFSTGIGSPNGPGYTVEIRISTLRRVSRSRREEIREAVQCALEKHLPAAFPGKELHVCDERGVLRIHGDLSP